MLDHGKVLILTHEGGVAYESWNTLFRTFAGEISLLRHRYRHAAGIDQRPLDTTPRACSVDVMRVQTNTFYTDLSRVFSQLPPSGKASISTG